MSNFTIAIVGAGLIGTSFGLALKREQDPPRVLVHDKELGRAQAGVKKGAFDRAEWNLINTCEPADLIILAIPLHGLRPTLEAIAPYLKQGAVITDTARTKTPVLAWAEALLPPHAHFVGGDPVVHAGGTGPEQASVDLFRGRLYCLTPAPAAPESAVQLLAGLVALVGAEPFFLDAVEHDGLMAAVEHLPGLASLALVSLLAGQGSWRELRKLAGPLFEEVSAGAAGEPEALRESLWGNRANLTRWLDSYMAELARLRAWLETGDEAGPELNQALERAVTSRQEWLADYQRGSFVDPELLGPKVESRGFMRRLIGLGR